MGTHIHFILFWIAIFLLSSSNAVPIPLEQENASDNPGRQIQNILDIPQQVASFIGNALFPTTPTTTERATTPAATPKTVTRRATRAPISYATAATATVPGTPKIKYVYVSPPPPRVVIVKPRPFAPAAPTVVTEAPAPTEPITEAAEGGDEDEDTEEEGI